MVSPNSRTCQGKSPSFAFCPPYIRPPVVRADIPQTGERSRQSLCRNQCYSLLTTLDLLIFHVDPKWYRLNQWVLTRQMRLPLKQRSSKTQWVVLSSSENEVGKIPFRSYICFGGKKKSTHLGLFIEQAGTGWTDALGDVNRKWKEITFHGFCYPTLNGAFTM